VPILFPHPLDQQFLTEGLCYSYSIDLRYAAMLIKLDKEIVFGCVSLSVISIFKRQIFSLIKYDSLKRLSKFFKLFSDFT
tara:strand:+ start:27 stop:266 length:240 start_codon:yes stop_codon:yes gene_type:complete